MKLFLDFFPLAVFVGVYFYVDVEPMYPAVLALMIAVIIQNIGTRLITGKFEKLHLWTLLVTLVLGSMTLFFRNPQFVQWKASIVVWIIAGVFIFRQYVSKKLLIQEMMQNAMEEEMLVPQKVWASINISWPIGYVVFGLVNLLVAYNYSEAFWVKFKLFGLLALTIILLIYTVVRLMPYFPQEESNDLAPSTPADKDNNPESKEP